MADRFCTQQNLVKTREQVKFDWEKSDGYL